MTREELIHMADASGLSYYGMGKDRERFIAHLQRFADIVAEGAAFAEREACAKLCDDHWNKSIDCGDKAGALQCVGIRTTIRARGQA